MDNRLFALGTICVSPQTECPCKTKVNSPLLVLGGHDEHLDSQRLCLIAHQIGDKTGACLTGKCQAQLSSHKRVLLINILNLPQVGSRLKDKLKHKHRMHVHA